MHIKAMITIEMENPDNIAYIVETACGHRFTMSASRTLTLEQRIDKLMGYKYKYPVTIFKVIKKQHHDNS